MAEILATRTKDPDAKLEYGFNFSDWLYSGDQISTAAWTVPTGLTTVSTQVGTEKVKIIVSGGTAGENYKLSCKITTTDGRIDERSFALNVENR